VARAEEILAAQRLVLEAAGFRVGVEIGELSVSPGTRDFHEALPVDADSLQRIPLPSAAGPVCCRLRRHDLVLTSATLTPEGIRVRYHGDALESDSHGSRALHEEINEEITELPVTDGTSGTCLVPASNVHGVMPGRRSAPGRVLWIPKATI
jgi:hypothetical protein